MRPELTRDTILAAMQRFNHELRPTWRDLETAPNVVLHDGLLYPIWQVVTMAVQHTPQITLTDAIMCLRAHAFPLLRVNSRRVRARKGILPHAHGLERDFEDDVIIPLFVAWGVTYQRQYRCCFPSTHGRIDFFLRDQAGTLMLFENKAQIRNDTHLEAARVQAQRYAQWYRLPSFVVAAPEGLWIYAKEPQRTVQCIPLSMDKTKL